MGARALQYAAVVLDDPSVDIDTTAACLLMVLADRANPDGIAWPSTAWLARRCRCSEDTIWRARRRLVAAGIIAYEPGCGSRHTGRHRFPIAAWLSTSPAPTRGFGEAEPPRPRDQTPAPTRSNPRAGADQYVDDPLIDPAQPPWVAQGETFDSWRRHLP